MTARNFKARSRKLTLLTVAAALAGAFASATVLAGEPVATDDAKARYLKERANCEAGNTTQDKATCLKEAGAALDEKKKGKLDNSGSPVANATDRCNVLPAKDKADCLARIVGPLSPNQRVTISGSVEGGGVIRETTTTTPGGVIIIHAGPGAHPGAGARQRALRRSASSPRPAAPGRAAALSSPPLPASAVAALHITDIESAINWWREKKPSPDGITACAEVLALAEVYALMVYYHEAECDEASMPAAAQAAWLAWYATTPDAPCIAICSTSQGDAICKGCGRSFEEVQRWTSMSPAEKRATWRRITQEGTAWRFNRYAERALPGRG